MYIHRNAGPRRSRIIGVGSYLPDQVVTSHELEADIAAAGIDMAPGFIERATGIRSRHVAAEGENASDLATAAGQAALTDAGLAPLDVDLLIFAAASHDITEPATANIVQTKMGAHNATVFDLKNACNSLMTAIDVADAHIQTGRGRIVLIATGEMPTRARDLRFASREDVLARFAHLTFGDAGGALVLAPSPAADYGLVAMGGVTRGEAWHLATILSFGTMHPGNSLPEGAYFNARSSELEHYGRTEVPGVVRAVLSAADWKPQDVDVVAGHQHSERILREMAETVGIATRALSMPLRYAGNAVSANVALALTRARDDGLLAPGSRVLLANAGSGFSANAIAARW
jgi:3-oxoacyl-[acyl-carrier-protein] synthase-3